MLPLERGGLNPISFGQTTHAWSADSIIKALCEISSHQPKSYLFKQKNKLNILINKKSFQKHE
jgi:hypothetical protein